MTFYCRVAIREEEIEIARDAICGQHFLQPYGHNLFDLENLLETSKNQRFHHPFSMRFHRLAWTAVALLAVSALSSQNGEYGVILK